MILGRTVLEIFDGADFVSNERMNTPKPIKEGKNALQAFRLKTMGRLSDSAVTLIVFAEFAVLTSVVITQNTSYWQCYLMFAALCY